MIPLDPVGRPAPPKVVVVVEPKPVCFQLPHLRGSRQHEMTCHAWTEVGGGGESTRAALLNCCALELALEIVRDAHVHGTFLNFLIDRTSTRQTLSACQEAERPGSKRAIAVISLSSSILGISADRRLEPGFLNPHGAKARPTGLHIGISVFLSCFVLFPFQLFSVCT